MGTPEDLRPKPPKWKEEAKKYDLERMGLVLLNKYIAMGLEYNPGNTNIMAFMEDMKDMLIKSSSRPYVNVALSIIRISSDLAPYKEFLLGWDKYIKEPADEWGDFNPIERGKWWNYHIDSIHNLLLDMMCEWRKIAFEKTINFHKGKIKAISNTAFEYTYGKHTMIIRPPMEGERAWAKDMIQMIGPFSGRVFDRYYKVKERNLYLRKYRDKYEGKVPFWSRKTWF